MHPTTPVESNEGTLAKDQSVDDKSGSWGTTNGGLALKKGPWTSDEDAILVDYVKKYGEGNWNAVQKYSGLSRCGKSCRLRWANHLRPNLKKGAFSSEEEMLIVELHAKMGNKWARMSAHLPGRTDNEIKNYWNTRIKRRQRAGLPLYSSELSMKASQEGRHGSSFHGVKTGSEGFFSSSTCQFPDVALESLKANQGLLSYIPELADLSGSSLPMKSFGDSQYGGQTPSTACGHKRLREPPASLYSSFCGIPKDVFSSLHTYEDDDGGERINRSFHYSYPTDEDPQNNFLPSFDAVQGDHSFSNGPLSSSKKIPEALKIELPSFQYPEADLGSSWDKSPYHPALLESVDGFTQCTSKSGKVESQCLSPRNNGLLETLVYEAKTMSTAKNQSSDKSSNNSALTPVDISSSSLDICKTELDEYGDPSSPLGHSATSIFNEHSPVSAAGSTLDDQQHAVDISQASNVKEEPFDQLQGPEREQETRTKCDYTMTRPDTLHASSDWFGLRLRGLGGKAQAPMSEPIASLLGEDLSSDYEQTQTVVAYYASSDQALELGFSSYAWNMMPAACQMSELP